MSVHKIKNDMTDICGELTQMKRKLEILKNAISTNSFYQVISLSKDCENIMKTTIKDCSKLFDETSRELDTFFSVYNFQLKRCINLFTAGAKEIGSIRTIKVVSNLGNSFSLNSIPKGGEFLIANTVKMFIPKIVSVIDETVFLINLTKKYNAKLIIKKR